MIRELMNVPEEAEPIFVQLYYDGCSEEGMVGTTEFPVFMVGYLCESSGKPSFLIIDFVAERFLGKMVNVYTKKHGLIRNVKFDSQKLPVLGEGISK